MKKIIIAIFAALVAVAASAQEQQQVQNQVMEETVNEYKILSDKAQRYARSRSISRSRTASFRRLYIQGGAKEMPKV